jgi:hypothetical protein
MSRRFRHRSDCLCVHVPRMFTYHGNICLVLELTLSQSGLFSTVSTSFIVAMEPNLRPDPNDTMLPIRTAHLHVYAVHYSCDGGTLLTRGYNNAITFWDIKTREAVRFVEACHASQQVHCVIWTPYDRFFWGVVMESCRQAPIPRGKLPV